MQLDDRNKINRLEELKSKLFSKNYQSKIEHRDTFSHRERRDVLDSWKTREKVEQDRGEKFFLQTSMFKKFFIFSLIFFIATLGYAAYVFFIGSNTVSNNNIDISVLGNNFTAGGEELSLIIGITNKNSTSLDLVDMVVEYPKGSEAEPTSETERFRRSLGTISAGSVRNENLKLILFGEQGSIRPIRIAIEYRVEGSNAIFVKEKFYEVTISSTPINLSVDAPLSISPDQDITLNVKETLNATKPVSKILVKLDYPTGFVFTKAVPAPSFGNNVWSLGDLAPGVEHNILISGKMTDVFDGEEKTFNVSTGSQSDTSKSTISLVFNSTRHTVMIKKPFIEAGIFVDGLNQKEYAVDWKTASEVEIRYANNLDTKVDDLRIEAKISGNSINRKTIIAPRGFYDSANDTIVWDRNSLSQLREVNPGDSGSVSFSFSPLSPFSTTGGLLPDPSVNVAVSISGKRSMEGFAVDELSNFTSATLRIISDIGFSTKALFATGPFVNTGPTPPKVGNKTTYTIIWTIGSATNNISKAQVSATLPSWITFVGNFDPVSENLNYNPSTREIIWNIGKIAKGINTIGTKKEVAFQIAFTPSLSQIGDTPTIISNAILTGHDDFANVDVRLNKTSLTTRIDGGMDFSGAGGVVSE